MRHHVHTAALALVAVAPLVAQTPTGWKMRADGSATASDPGGGSINFVTMGSGFHAMNPQGAVYWKPANTVSGTYTLKGTFTLMKPSGDANYYGLVFGGSDLEGPQRKYLYFMVAQNGTWLIKRRDGATEEYVSPKLSSDAVKKPDAGGKSTNVLEVRVGTDAVEYVVNGELVHTTPRIGATAKTDGIHGVRITPLLDVQVDGLTASKYISGKERSRL